MGDGIVIPLRPEPNPSDEELARFLRERISEYQEKVNDFVAQVWETEEDTEEQGQPKEFAFGKMLKYLGSLENEEVYKLAAGALWNISQFI